MQINDEILPLFDNAAEELIGLHDGDSKKALMKALAFMSGANKQAMTNRSLT